MLDERLISDLFEEAVRRSGAYGAQLSIIKGGQQMDLAAGVAHAKRGTRMTTDTAMQIGSITKVFNATIVMTLVQEGLLDLDTPVKRYLPGFAVGDERATQTLTLRHLLSMSSGLDNGRYVYFGTGADALEQYVRRLASLPQRFPPGRFFGYSNAGICIAGLVAAMVAGKPWETLLRERVAGPAGLSSAIVLDEDLDGRPVSVGHVTPDGSDEPTIVEPTFSRHRSRGPSGPCLALATRDLARFGAMFVRRGLADTGERILSGTLVDLMAERQIDVPSRMYADAWCLGPWTNRWNGVRQWGHAGGTSTSASFLQWIPEHEGVVAFNVNTGSAVTGLQKAVFTQIMAAAFGFAKPPTATVAGPLGPRDVHRYVGRYEHLGATIQVTPGEDGMLRARLVPNRTADERAQHPEAAGGVERTVVLQPLDADRFLLRTPSGPDPYQGEIDTAFFGDDGAGRATNLLDGLFATTRV